MCVCCARVCVCGAKHTHARHTRAHAHTHSLCAGTCHRHCVAAHEYRSHFGSRYKLGCCGLAGLLLACFRSECHMYVSHKTIAVSRTTYPSTAKRHRGLLFSAGRAQWISIPYGVGRSLRTSERLGLESQRWENRMHTYTHASTYTIAIIQRLLRELNPGPLAP